RELVQIDAGVGELPAHRPAVEGIFGRGAIDGREREAKTLRIDRARQVVDAVLASSEVQLGNDGEDVDHGAASPGQRRPFSASSRCACANAASSLTSIQSSSCGYASTASRASSSASISEGTSIRLPVLTRSMARRPSTYVPLEI